LLLATVRFNSRRNGRLTPASFQIEPSVLSSVVNVLDRRQTPDPSTGLSNLPEIGTRRQISWEPLPGLEPSPRALPRHTLYAHRTVILKPNLPSDSMSLTRVVANTTGNENGSKQKSSPPLCRRIF
jgi:hypothetical protein